MRIVPMGDRVVLERTEAVQTRGRIIIPETAMEKPLLCRVVALADEGCADESCKICGGMNGKLKVGDQVLVGKYSGVEVEFEGRKLLICRFEEILVRTQEGED